MQVPVGRSFGVVLGRWELGKWSCGIVGLESWEGALWMQDETGGMEFGDKMIYMTACTPYFLVPICEWEPIRWFLNAFTSMVGRYNNPLTCQKKSVKGVFIGKLTPPHPITVSHQSVSVHPPAAPQHSLPGRSVPPHLQLKSHWARTKPYRFISLSFRSLSSL